MAKMNRRHILRVLGSIPAAACFTWTTVDAQKAHHQVQRAREAARQGITFRPKFFTNHEYRTVRVLVDIIIPKDERSGSATEAGVPEFMDFMMTDPPAPLRPTALRQGFSSQELLSARQTAMRGGLAWLDMECARRFDRTFRTCTEAARKQVLEDIAWPATARPELSHGVAFFNSFRDLTATGFWTSKTGIEDLEFQGNVFVGEWTGCPEGALKKLGVKYDD